MKKLASVQETSLDIVWIRESVVCLGSRLADRCYRAVLAVEGPPEAFAQEVERVQPLLDGFARFLNALGQPGVLPRAVVQALVLAEPTDLTEYATRLEERASALPPHLAREALADAAWARQNGPGLGLLDRHAYVVVPAESVPGARLLGGLDSVRARLANWFGANPALDEAGARLARVRRSTFGARSLWSASRGVECGRTGWATRTSCVCFIPAGRGVATAASNETCGAAPCVLPTGGRDASDAS